MEEEKMEVEVVHSEEVDVKPEEPFNVEILPFIKDAQQSHGLRHGDYTRYRQYCTRRLKRIRNSLNFKLGTRHGFKGKKITEDIVTDSRHLHMVLVEAERCWAYAMELKLSANTEPRKRFHMMRKLAKAAQYGEELYQLCDTERVEPRTTLEAQAYHFWMTANLKFELQEWKVAVDLYTQAQSIYEKLSTAFVDEQTKSLYMQRVEEIKPNIRYCAYNLGQGGMDIEDLMKMKASAVGQDQLSAKIDAAIKQTREKLASSFGEVTWGGRSVPLRNEKARVFIIHQQEKDTELSRQPTFDEKMEVFDNLLMECKEALQSVKDDIAAELSAKKKNETNVAQLQFVKTYLSYLRQNLTVSRNMCMIDSMKEKLPIIVGPAKPSTNKGKVTKPEDLIRLFDGIILSLAEIGQLQGLEDDGQLEREVEAQMTAYKGFRCFYIAQSYHVQQKWVAAISLNDRVITYVTDATAKLKHCNNPAFNVLVTKLEELSEQANGHKFAAHASSILETSEVKDGMENINLSDKVLAERLDVYRELKGDPKKVSLVQFPPQPEPLPCKPLFFDLALNHIQLPKLDHRMEKKSQPGGLSGIVKGWLWGNK